MIYDEGGDATFDSYRHQSDKILSHKTLTDREKMSHTFKALAGVVASHCAALEGEFEYLANKRANQIEL